MQDLTDKLQLPARFFLTREKGEVAYTELLTVLQTVPEGEPLILEFPPEQLIDASFADEALLRLAEGLLTGDYGEKALLLQGLTADSLHNIDAVIHLRNLKLALLAVEPNGAWQVIGQLEKSLRETLDLLAEQPTLTAPILAAQIGTAVNTASNRLKRLYDGRLICRQEEVSEKGREYLYHFWRWDV
ncbi:MAG: hypothetical protein ACOYL5_13765 [Phototrophicaceae bacterium]